MTAGAKAGAVRIRVGVAASLVAALLVAAPVRAGKVEDLAAQLDDDNYKVRIIAALALGKLGDPAGVSPLVKALSDQHRLVRATAAEALGRLGNAAAVSALKSQLIREQDGYVRGKLDRALAALGGAAAGGGDRKGGRIFLTFGPFSGGARSADAGMLEVLRSVLRRELAKHPSVTFDPPSADNDKNLAKAGRLGFLIDGNVSRLDEGLVGGANEINCDVKVQVLRWPSKSLILWTNAGAAVQGGSGPRERDTSRRQCLEATATQLGEDLLKFLQSQGG